MNTPTAHIATVIHWFIPDSQGVCTRCHKHVERRSHMTEYQRVTFEDALAALMKGEAGTIRFVKEHFEAAHRQQQANHFAVAEDGDVCYDCAVQALKLQRVSKTQMVAMGVTLTQLHTQGLDPHTVVANRGLDGTFQTLVTVTQGEPNLLECLEEILRGDNELKLGL